MTEKKECVTFLAVGKAIHGIHYGPMTWDGNQGGKWKCENCGRYLWDE